MRPSVCAVIGSRLPFVGLREQAALGRGRVALARLTFAIERVSRNTGSPSPVRSPDFRSADGSIFVLAEPRFPVTTSEAARTASAA
jgi:hypothetical protein